MFYLLLSKNLSWVLWLTIRILGVLALLCGVHTVCWSEHAFVFLKLFISAVGKAEVCGQHLACILNISYTPLDTPFSASSHFHIHSVFTEAPDLYRLN